jgi:hypothetical protein
LSGAPLSQTAEIKVTVEERLKLLLRMLEDPVRFTEVSMSATDAKALA